MPALSLLDYEYYKGGNNMFSLKGESKKMKISVVAILIIFLATCIGVSLYYGNDLLLGSLEKMDNDDVKYLRSANTLLETGKLTYGDPEKSTVFIMPGIVFVLAPFVKIFGMVGAITPFRIFSAYHCLFYFRYNNRDRKAIQKKNGRC